MLQTEITMKELIKAETKMMKYFKAHPRYNGFAHMMIGLGLGILMTYPIVGVHPIRWGVIITVVGLLVHLYPLIA